MLGKNLQTRFMAIFIFSFWFISGFVSSKTLFLVYAQTKNNLNSYFVNNLRDMAKIGSNKNLEILVQWEQPNKNGIWRYKVNPGSIDLVQHIASPAKRDVVTDIVEFVRWGVGTSPADNYCLILSGHGSGYIDPRRFSPRGILFDWESNNYLSNPQLVDVLDKIKRNILGGKNLDVLGMDACSMASIEMDYQVKNKVNLLVASEEQEHADGWCYSEIFSAFKNKALGSEELATRIVNSFGKFYEKRVDWYTQSAVKIGEMENLKNVFNQILVDLQSCKKVFGNAITTAVKNARKNCLQFNVPIYVDLHSFYLELYNQLKGKSAKMDIAYSSEGNIEQNNNYRAFVIDRPKTNELIQESLPIVINDMLDFSGTTTSILDLTMTKTADGQSLNLDFDGLDNVLNGFEEKDFDFDVTAVKSVQVEQLRVDLLLGMQLIEKAVLSNVTGKNFNRAKGISIYFPRNSYIEASYVKSEFAKDTLWVQFLMEYMR